MNKLNNRGWGPATFLTFLGVLFIALLITVSMVNYFEFGLKQGDSNVIYDDGDNIEETDYNYPYYESRLVDLAYDYIVNEEINLTDGELMIIKKSKLNEDSSIYDHCDAYVTVEKHQEEVIYQAYINCGDYISNNYDKNFE